MSITASIFRPGRLRRFVFTTLRAGAVLICLLVAADRIVVGDEVTEKEEHFEKSVRPLLIQKCYKCHAGNNRKGGLRLDSLQAALKGGESGPAVIISKPEDSLLLQAVRQENGLEMPPEGKLDQSQIDALAKWIREGAVWPGDEPTAPVATAENDLEGLGVLMPNSEELVKTLQLWLRAESLDLSDGEAVYVWPDASGHGRDLSATRGVRVGGVGKPGTYVFKSNLNGRPGIRFSPETGLASSPGNPVDIHGDASLTITLVLNLEQFEGQPSHSAVFHLGNAAHAGDPGKPLAALIEIDQAQGGSLDFAGGHGHDAILAQNSYKPLYDKTSIITIVKTPGPINQTTRFYINGKLAGPLPGNTLEGRDTIPDIQHREDVGVFLGKALGWSGAIQGDVGEVLLYNSALPDAQRLAVEAYLGQKYGLWIDKDRMVVKKSVYTDEEKKHWAYQPVKTILPPNVDDESWVKTPVDRFTLTAFNSHSVKPATAMGKREYLRRVTFDLTGLPPSPDQVESFLKDESPTAYKIVVDRLLNSEAYGERWGRHWLDLVRYAETTANDANAVMRYAWRYRNYVIDAFNNDLPYDQFLLEQLAGDLLPATDSVELNTRRVIGTGYLMIGPKALAETDKEQSRLDIVDDQIDVTGRAMLGLTISCARCHDHKFDAIRTNDYYALAGIFRSTEPFQNENRNATMWWEYPVPQGEGAEPLMVMAPKETMARNLRVHIRGNRFTLGKIVPRGMPGVVDAVVASQGDEEELPSNHAVDPHQQPSGRLELARWISSPTNPLTPRVLVNRVWQLHFGQGIVSTPDNFGIRGGLPAQPALLDWLTGEFVNNGWSVKALHRLIVLSNTYRQSNTTAFASEELAALAPLVVQRRRLSAEELRDAMLAVSGELDGEPGTSESGDFLFGAAEDISAMIRPNRVAADDEYYTTFKKRSVYLPVVRNMLPDVLSLFDAADPNGVTAIRNETTVASQGLFLLNHPIVRDQARAMAKRLLAVEASALGPQNARVELAHQLAFARSATALEIEDTNAFLKAYIQTAKLDGVPESDGVLKAWQAFCQSLLCSNEFLYVE